MLADKLTIPL